MRREKNLEEAKKIIIKNDPSLPEPKCVRVSILIFWAWLHGLFFPGCEGTCFTVSAFTVLVVGPGVNLDWPWGPGLAVLWDAQGILSSPGPIPSHTKST